MSVGSLAVASISHVLHFFSDTFQEVKSKRDKKKEVSQLCFSNYMLWKKLACFTNLLVIVGKY
jgi:hypothetical protein